MMEARSIQLRRPPVLVRMEGRFVPPAVALDEVDARWAALCAANPRTYDGALLHVLGTSRNGHGGVQVHVQECSYRFYAVQQDGPGGPALDCGVRPLGVKGIATDGERVLVGRRSRAVAFYPGAWEFVPGGSVEPGALPAEEVVRELREEAGLAAVGPAIAVALLFDPHAFSWEIVHRLRIDAAALPEIGWEYDEFRLLGREALGALGERGEIGALGERGGSGGLDGAGRLDGSGAPASSSAPLAPVARQMLPIAARLLAGAQARE
jgi:8-oxo-dGTP pyrophosphatase MutT (NUDIX family)